ncbi:MAG: hypothetical protein ABTD50_06525 [Polyangiaceae bacterium]|jgi:hypothetical protein
MSGPADLKLETLRLGPAVVDAPDGSDVVDTLDGLRPRSAASPAASAAN